MAGFQFSVSWDAYQKSICNGLTSLQQSGKFVDMTIAADGHLVKVHQMVMSLVSPYIEDLIASAACPHPVIFLNGVSYQTLQLILQYVYTGEVLVEQNDISPFLDACKALHIRGVSNMNTNDNVFDKCMKDPFENSTNAMEYETKQLHDRQTLNTLTGDFDDGTDTAFDEDSESDTKPYTASASPNKREPSDKQTSSSANKLSSLDQTVQLQYTVSNQGKIQLICNRYVYFLMSARKSGERMWRCVTYRNNCMCRAFLVTKNNKIIRRVGVHNHPFHDKIILKRLDNGNVFSALNDIENHIGDMKISPKIAISDTETDIENGNGNGGKQQGDFSDLLSL